MCVLTGALLFCSDVQSLFGLPLYQAEVIGRLQVDIDPANNNAQGCKPYTPGSFPSPDAPHPPMIALIARGGCRFGQKALLAQQAGANAIVVYTTQLGVQYPLPVMAGGPETTSLSIPGMFINYHDGTVLAQDVAAWTLAVNTSNHASPLFDGVWLSLSYSIIAPDDRVEWDFYTTPDESESASFLQTIQPIVAELGTKAYFTPHYYIMDGSVHGWLAKQKQKETWS